MLQDAGGRSISSLVTCTRQNNTSCIEPSTLLSQARVARLSATRDYTLLALRLHSRTPSSCSPRWTSNTCKPYTGPRNSINYRKRVCSKQRMRSFPLDFKYSLWTSSADVNNGVGCLGSGCLQMRRAGDEKQWITLEWPYCKVLFVAFCHRYYGFAVFPTSLVTNTSRYPFH